MKQNIVLDIFRDVEVAKSIVWRKGASEENSLTGTIQFLKFQFMTAVQSSCFLKCKRVFLYSLRLETIGFNFNRVFLIYSYCYQI